MLLSEFPQAFFLSLRNSSDFHFHHYMTVPGIWCNIKHKNVRFKTGGLEDDRIAAGLQRIREATSIVGYRLSCPG